MDQESILNIGEASRVLGVSEAALRLWTDEGKIKAFLTPGRHRRYARADLKKFMGSQPRMLGVKDLVSGIEETVELYHEIARKSTSSIPWYSRLNQESKEHLADMGRQFLNLIIKYITEPSKREETTRLIRQVGQEMGETLAMRGFSLSDSVEAFLMHREPIISASTSLLKKREAFSGRVVDAISLVINVIDETLVTLVASHQQYQNGKNKPKEKR